MPRAQATFRDRKKLADKERKQVEEAARAKEAALRDDDNVFDVAYEQQGGGGADGGDVLSATDIKVPLCAGQYWPNHCCCGLDHACSACLCSRLLLQPDAGDLLPGSRQLSCLSSLLPRIQAALGSCVAVNPAGLR